MENKPRQPQHDTPHKGVDHDKLEHAPHGIPPGAGEEEAMGVPSGRKESETAADGS